MYGGDNAPSSKDILDLSDPSKLGQFGESGPTNPYTSDISNSLRALTGDEDTAAEEKAIADAATQEIIDSPAAIALADAAAKARLVAAAQAKEEAAVAIAVADAFFQATGLKAGTME